MAELTTMRNDVLGYPIYGLPYVVAFPILDVDGDPVTGLTPDSEISKNGDTAVDTATEGAEITFDTATNKGMYQLQLSAAEMTCDVAAITVYTGSADAQSTCLVLYPKKLPLIESGTAGAVGNDATHIHMTGKSAANDFYIGCIVFLKDHTGANQVRMITDYVGATCLATVSPAFATSPDDTTDYEIYLTDVAITTLIANNILLVNGAAPTTLAAAVTALAAAILATPANLLVTDASGQVTTGALANNAITAASINADAITNAKIADDAIAVENIKDAAITAAKIAGDAITNAKIADDAIGAENFATDAIAADAIAASGATEIATAVQTLMLGIKKNTALAKFSFVMRDNVNHLPLAGLAPTCTRSIDGGAFGAGTLANIAGVSNGAYVVDFGAGDLNGKVIMLRATSAGADDTFVTIVTAG